MKYKLYIYLKASICAFICWLIPSSVWAGYDVEVDGIYYLINSEAKTAKVSFNYNKPNHYSGDLIIPESFVYQGETYMVNEIHVFAFSNPDDLINDRLTSVTIPNSVTSIGLGAFYRCTNLTTVNIGSGVNYIGMDDSCIFSGCPNLTAINIDVNNKLFDSRDNCNAIIETSTNTLISGCVNTVIPNSVTSIGSYAFRYCSALTSVTIPNSVTSIGSHAFENSTDLTSIIVNPNNKTFDSRDNCNAIIETATNKLILGCKNTVIPNSVRIIDIEAFRGCIDLLSIAIPNSVSEIRPMAFFGCSNLTSVTIPNSVLGIGGYVFSNCPSLTSLVVASGNGRYDSRGNCNAIVETATNELIVGCKNTIIPENVKSIGHTAFCGCTDLTSVTIPSSVTEIGNLSFYDCIGLSSITVEGETPPSISSSPFDNVDFTSCYLYVPAGSKSAYESAEGWSEFQNIVEYTPELDVLATGSCGENVTYTIYSDKSMVISGTGPMCDFFIGTIGEDEEAEQFNNRENNAVWIQVKKVLIEEGVTSIGEYAFFNCAELTSVSIPNSVTSIGAFSFINCTNLTSITIPSSVAVIGDYAFSYSGLTHFTIEDGGGELLFGSSCGSGVEFFEECPLEYVYMGRDISTNNRTDVAMDQLIRWGSVTYPPFSGQSSLTTLVIGDNVTTLEDYSFSGAPLQSLVIGKNVQTLGMYALSSANIGQTITIPSNVTRVGDCCFSPSISKLVIEKSDNDLELYGGTYSTYLSFFVNSWESIVESVYLGRKFTYTSPYSPLNRFVTAYIDTELIAIPETVEYDDEGNAVSVLSYKPSPIQATNLFLENDGAVGRYYFNESGVEHIYNLNPSKAGDYAFAKCGVKTVTFNVNGSTSIASNMFEGCKGLTSLTIPEGVHEIGCSSFENCIRLECVKIPNSVTTIGNGAFFNCKLSDFYVGSIPAQIFETTFGFWGDEEDEEYQTEVEHTLHVPYGCKSLYENAEYWDYFDNIVEDGGNLDILATGSCGDNVTYTIYSDNTMVISGNGPMWDYEDEVFWYKKPERYGGYYDLVKKSIIEEGVTSVGRYAFMRFSSLSSLTIPSTVTSIGDLAFSFCNNLTSITIPNRVTSIGWGAFYGCSSLNSLFIPANVSIIESGGSIYDLGQNEHHGVFYGCSALNTISVDSNNPYYDSRDDCNAIIETSSNTLIAGCYSTIIPNGVTSIGDYAFYSCEGLTSVDIPYGVVEIDEGAFYNCSDLTSVTIPSSVNSIRDYAFWGCIGLTSVDIPNSVTSIGDGAFRDCTGLTSIKCESETPVTLPNSFVFFGVNKSTCTLYVPAGSKAAYENAEGWSEFENIVEYGEEPDTDISTLDNAIYVEQTEGRVGGTKDILVKMKNNFDVRGFQFTMELPEGTTVNSWTLNQGRMPAGTTMNKVFSTEGIDENVINVVCALNDGQKTFTGNDGLIATVNVSFAEDMEEGTYPIYLTNNSISDATAEYQLELSDIKSTLVLEDYVVGDTNGDGKVLVGDVIAILNYIVGSPSNNFNAKAADVNGDGKILVGDVIAVLNIIVNQ